MASLSDIQDRWDRHITSMVGAFESHLQNIVLRAQANMSAYLQESLSITDGVIDQTPANLRVLRTLDQQWQDLLDDAGYKSLVRAFVNEFPGQLQYVDETLKYLSGQLNTPLPMKWTSADEAIFSSFAQTARAGIDSAVSAAASGVMNRTMFTVGGLRFGTLVQTLADKFETSVARARTLAETSMVIFYRTATDRAFQSIEKDAPAFEMRYRYTGPDDKLTRPFCRHLVESDQSYTRDQIDRMRNGQLDNVFLSGGGWNCRHSFLIETRP